MTFRTRCGTKQVPGVGHYYEECLLLSARACPSSGAMALSKSQGPCSLRDRVAEVVTGIPNRRAKPLLTVVSAVRTAKLGDITPDGEAGEDFSGELRFRLRFGANHMEIYGDIVPKAKVLQRGQVWGV